MSLKKEFIILGIDPGSIRTGFGLIKISGREIKHIENGIIAPPPKELFKNRVAYIFSGVIDVIKEFSPQYISLEDIFVAKNAQSALKLGHIRGAVMSASFINNIPLWEFSPTHIKQAITGKGRATKSQIQFMVKTLLGLKEFPQEDASDALAAAITLSFSVK